MVLAHDISKGDRTRDVKISQNITFETMLLAPNTMYGLKDSGFHKPSPIQLYGIPIGKCGFDLLLEAKSGTGKTAVFSIIALEKIDFCKGLQVVILTPTREIAAQICDVLKQIGSRYKELRVEVVMGGLPLQDDIEKFKKPVHIVVGSPGRLRHLIQNKCLDVKSVRLLVLDEADKLMESSFQSDIKYIHTSLPKQKQVIMSSATYPESSRDLINSYVQNASHVCPDSDCVLLGIVQKVSIVKYNNNIIRHTQDKFNELHKILGRLQFKQCLVFCNYQVRVAEVHKLLKKAEWPSQKLYGQQEQVDRLDALKTLQQYKCRILVSTDLAARGIDASNIDLVVNFEPPYDWQTYLHRIGRAGRFGSYGTAITILSEGKEQQKFREMFDSMELPINMRHLWSDKEFNINSLTQNVLAENSTTKDLPEKVSYDDTYWELLSCKSNVIEIFESQCKLDEYSESPKIEPFSELINSLADNFSQTTNDDIAFKHIEMVKTSVNSSVDSQSSGIEKDIVNTNLKECDNENMSKNIKEKSKQLQIVANESPQNGNNTTTNKNLNKEIIKQNDINKTLLSLDLPIMFSSSKFKIDKSKQKTISENKTFSNNFNNNKDLRINYKSSQLQQDSEILEVNNASNDLKFNKKEEKHYRPGKKVDNHYDGTYNYYKKDNKYNNARQQNFTNSYMRKNSLVNHIEHRTNEKLYSNWYNQLKLKIKCLEQAIYIEEMSKL